MAFWSWSKTAANNASADGTINWAEGQAPSSVNDSARAMMARAAEYRDDTAGNLLTAGTSTAYTLTTNQVFDTFAHMDGQELSFIIHANNGAAPTLNVDGLGAIALYADGNAIPAATLISGSVYTAVYRNASSQWRLKSFFVNPYNVPIGGGMIYFGATVPNASFAFPNGAAISRATYATLFALIGTTHGSGDGSTTFNLPDLTGRVPAMKEAVATRLTTAVGGVDGATLGAAGGSQSSTLVSANLPPQTPAGTLSSITSTTPDFMSNANHAVAAVGNPGTPIGFGFTTNPTIGAVSSTGTFTGTAFAGQISTPVRTVQPTMICNYIMRII